MTEDTGFGNGRDPADWIADIGGRVVNELADGYRRLRTPRPPGETSTGGRRLRPPSAQTRARAHHLLDRAFELADVLIRAGAELGGGLAHRASRTGDGAFRPRSSESGAPPALVLPPAGPGEVSTGKLVLENARSSWLDAVRLRCTGLVAGDGAHITARYVTFEPPTLELAGGKESDVAVTVRVPKTAKSGMYAGMIHVVGMPTVMAIVTLEVR